MEAARGLAQFEHRRTIVVCLWSNEENGYDGSDMWIETIPAETASTLLLALMITKYTSLTRIVVRLSGSQYFNKDESPNTKRKENGQRQICDLHM